MASSVPAACGVSPKVHYVEKIVEVPQVIYEERIVEVPKIEYREVIKQAPWQGQAPKTFLPMTTGPLALATTNPWADLV